MLADNDIIVFIPDYSKVIQTCFSNHSLPHILIQVDVKENLVIKNYIFYHKIFNCKKIRGRVKPFPC